MIQNVEKFEKNRRKQEVLGIFSFERGGGSPIPKSICQNSCQKVNILMKTKNAPQDLKCKINHTFFFGNRGSQKGGRGGGSDTWEIFPKNPVFSFGWRPLHNKEF